ncbi:MAG TPA: polysaccharide biosynthesis/export family protein [Bryobacteraceae bacterium]|nr:polysaccharide biosynthesis/export family protein [Bryobacteraceae bacterium]
MQRILLFSAVCVASAGLGLAQQKDAQPAGVQPTASAANVSPSYVLGPNDQIAIQVLELPEIQAKSYRLDSDGTVDVPLAGTVRLGGLTLTQARHELENRLHSQVKDPHVSVSLLDSRSEPVSVLGAVNGPGTQQIEGSKTLFDVLAGAGGLKQDAGDTVIITRQKDEGPLNLPNTVVDPATGRSTAEVSVHDLVDLRLPGVNIPVRPHDEVFVAPGKVMYVIGNVRKPGGFTLSGKRGVSALEALSLAEGFAPDAAPKSARILRRTSDADLTRKQIPVNLKRILAGKAEDVAIYPDDILFVPDSKSKKIISRTAEAAIATVSGIIIWRGI